MKSAPRRLAVLSAALAASAALVVVVLAPPTFAQPLLPTQPAVPVDDAERAAAREAARAFARAMGEPDVAAAKALFAGTPEDFSLIEASRSAMRASARLKAASTKAFPADAAKRPASDDFTVAGMLGRIDRQEIKVAGDEAVVGTDSFKLKKSAGKWRVTALVASPTAATFVPTVMNGMASAMNGVAADVEAGKFKTAVEMQVALRTRARAEMAAGRPPAMAATRPATAPATRPTR